MKTERVLLRDAALFGLAALAVLLFWRNNLVLELILLVISLLTGAFFYDRTERLFFLLAGAFGLALETIGGLVGIWTYAFPNFVTVPVWIFFCWGFTLTLFHSIYLSLKK